MATDSERRLAFHRVRTLLELLSIEGVSVEGPSGMELTLDTFDALFERDAEGRPTMDALGLLELVMVCQDHDMQRTVSTAAELQRFFIITKDDSTKTMWCEQADDAEGIENAVASALMGESVWAVENILDLDSGTDIEFRITAVFALPVLPANFTEAFTHG